MGILLLSVLLLAAALLFALLRPSRSSRYPLPPGPKPLPFIGNIKDLPREQQWLTYAGWAKQYGNLMHATFFGTRFVILNSKEEMTELFEKRSVIYSDRPTLPMASDLMGWERWAFGLMHYGPKWRKHRKVFHQYFNLSATKGYEHIYLSETRRLLRLLLDDPSHFRQHYQLLASSTIMRIVYGIEVSDPHDKYVTVAERAMDGLSKAAVPGAFLVDIAPFLKYVPTWFPGADFQRKAKEWKGYAEAHIDKPFDAVVHAVTNGDDYAPSMISDSIETFKYHQNYKEEMTVVKNAAANAYAGGTDTTTSVLAAFTMTMALHPDVQEKAHAELDRVLSQKRLPTLSDKPDLPYVEAIVKEQVRWLPTSPLGTARRAIEDDVYRGYLIPKGSLIIPNIWSILHNETDFPNPSIFNPDRFLDKDGQLDHSILDPRHFAFGAGRRICPGRHLAMNSVFIAIASILTCFRIEPDIDQDGKVVPIDVKMSSGMLSHPGPFQCILHPRSEASVKLLKR